MDNKKEEVDLDVYSTPGEQDTYYETLSGEKRTPSVIRGINSNNQLEEQGLAIQALQIQTKQTKKMFCIGQFVTTVIAVTALGLCLWALSTTTPSSTRSSRNTSSTTTSSTPTGRMLNPVVLLTGGTTDNSSSQSVEVYSPLGTCNKNLEDLPYKCIDHSMDFFNGKIIICGGQQSSSRCLFLDQNQKFVQHSQLSHGHLDHVGAVVSNTLTIVGGRSNFVETWNGSQWETRSFGEIEDLQSNSCMDAISKDTLLMVGGSSDLGRKLNNKMMKYYKADKDQDGVWERMEDFPGPARHGLGCAFIQTPEGDSFLIAGGTTRGNSYQDTSFLYNIQKNKWEEVGKLSHVRLGGKIVVVDGMVLMLGGSYAPTTVEEYDVESKKWVQIEQKIKQARGQFDAVVVPGALVGC